MTSISNSALGDVGVVWPVENRWGKVRDSKTHMLRNGKVLCTSSGLPKYHLIVPLGDDSTVCKNCLTLSKRE